MNLASRGLRDMDGGPEKVEDAAELGQLRRQARKVWIESLLVAVVLTALAFALPVWR